MSEPLVKADHYLAQMRMHTPSSKKSSASADLGQWVG
jgi:hypothetical protein